MRKIISFMTVLFLLVTAGCGPKPSLTAGSIAKINDAEISDMEYRYFIEDTKYEYSLNGTEVTEEFLDQPYDDKRTVREFFASEALENLMNLYVIEEQAKTEGIVFDPEADKEEFESFKASYIEMMGGVDEFRQWLEKTELSEDALNSILKKILIQNRLMKKYEDEGFFEMTDEELRKEYDDNYLYVKHILTLFPENTIEASLGFVEENRDKAETDAETLEKSKEIYERVTAGGEDFDTVMKEESQDPGLADYPDGYVFAEGQMVTAFYEAAKALKVGEISQPVKTEYGYHIIKRLEHKGNDEKFEEMKENVRAKLENDRYGDLLSKWKSTMNVYIDDEAVAKVAK